MPDEIRRIDYYYATIPDKPGEASRILSALHQAGINLLGISAFPHGLRRSQLDLIPEDSAAFVKAAKGAGLKLSKKKSGFLAQGDDRQGQSPRSRRNSPRRTSTSHRCKPSALVLVATVGCSGSRH